MQLKSLFYVSAAFAAALAQSTTFDDIFESITNFQNQANRLNQIASQFPQSGLVFVTAVTSGIQVHNQIGVLSDAAAAATVTAQSFKGELTVANGTQIFQVMQAMEPVIQNTVKVAIARKSVIAGIPLRGGTMLAKGDMLDLLTTCTNFRNVLIPLVPAELKDQFTAWADGAQASLNQAIQAFSS